MKPIIITIKDNKISMSVEEFKKHIEDAYQQGYHDASSIHTSTNPYWWRDLNCNLNSTLVGNSTLNASDRTTTVVDGRTNDSISGTLKVTG